MPPKKIRVLHVITGLGVGGAENALLRLLQSMDASRFSNEVVSLSTEGPIAVQIKALGIPVHSLHLSKTQALVIGWRRLKDLIGSDRFDVVQSWMYHADLLSLLATKFSSGLPVVWNIRHSDLSWRANRKGTLAIAQICAWLSANGPEEIVVCAEAAKASHKAIGYDATKMSVIPNGIDSNKFSPHPELRIRKRLELGIAEHASLVGLVARYHPQKDHATFIEMASILCREHPETRFALIGEGCDESNVELATLLLRFGVASRFHLLGARSDVIELFSAMDLHVLSSRGEGFPNVLAEAMSCELPCISTRAGDAAFILGDESLCAEVGDARELARLASGILHLSLPDRHRLGARLRERVRSQFGLEAMRDAYQALYGRLLRQ